MFNLVKVVRGRSYSIITDRGVSPLTNLGTYPPHMIIVLHGSGQTNSLQYYNGGGGRNAKLVERSSRLKNPTKKTYIKLNFEEIRKDNSLINNMLFKR